MEMPGMFWMPAISPSSLIFYTGDRFPYWNGHLFVGALNGQQLQRIAFNQPPPQVERRESLLTQPATNNQPPPAHLDKIAFGRPGQIS
jgi:glucose/arabinose dehydrogenase